MSLIHDAADAQEWDVDSHVAYIADEVLGMRALIAYCQKLCNTYGFPMEAWEATPREPDDSSTLHSFFADFPSVYGPATVYVQLSKPGAQDDLDRILALMDAKCNFTRNTGGGAL
jgi:hypothetical protein